MDSSSARIRGLGDAGHGGGRAGRRARYERPPSLFPMFPSGVARLMSSTSPPPPSASRSTTSAAEASHPEDLALGSLSGASLESSNIDNSRSSCSSGYLSDLLSSDDDTEDDGSTSSGALAEDPVVPAFWDERTVFGSAKYEPNSIFPHITIWTPTTDDEVWLDRLEEVSPKLAPSPHRDEAESAASAPATLLATRASEDSTRAKTSSATLAELVSEDSTARSSSMYQAVVKEADLLLWGMFHQWNPVPNEEEAGVLAAIARQEEEQRRAIAQVKRQERLRRYGRFAPANPAHRSAWHHRQRNATAVKSFRCDYPSQYGEN